MKLNKFFILIFIFLFFLSLTSAVYTISNPRLTAGGTFTAFGGDSYDIGFNDEMCKEGQDFIIQIDPLGCSPSVVRSDLLEEQDVPVFCRLQAIKVNPIIDIEAIRSVSIKGEYPPEVKTVGNRMFPSMAALGENQRLNNLMWDEIGYVIVFLRQQRNESLMPEYVEGNLTARITYDLNNAFGIRHHSFYLPVLEDNEFERRMGQYAFFDRRGYLRAEHITEDSAFISIYSGRYKSPFGRSREGEIQKQRIFSDNLRKGESTGRMFLPGLGCYAGVKFTLQDIKYSDTRARLSVNSELFEVEREDSFLEEKCSVLVAEKRGINERVRIRCNTDEGPRSFELNVNPSIKISIDGGESIDVNVGEFLYEGNRGDVYLAYADTSDGSDDEEKLELYLVSLSGRRDRQKLDDNSILAAYYIAKGSKSIREGGSYLDRIGATMVRIGGSVIRGEDFKKVEFGEPTNIGGNYIEIIGFGGKGNYPLKNEVRRNYELAIKEYDEILSNYRQEKYPDDKNRTISEEALYSKIKLASTLKQNQDLSFFCEDFEELFSESTLDVSICENFKQLSNEGISSQDLLIGGDYRRIDLETIIQPSYEEYGARISVSGLGEDSREMITYELEKNQIVNLDGGDYFRLVEVREDTAKIELHIEDRREIERAERMADAVYSSNEVLMMNRVERFGTKYSFTLSEVNLERVAKVVVSPSVDRVESEAEFNFKIGIEKRAIQLSPEKTKERIEKLNKTIDSLEKISSNLETIVEAGKKVCLATGVVLTAKNLIEGMSGKTLARQEVMRGEGGWYEKCSLLVSQNMHSSVENCFLENAEKIDGEVELITETMRGQNSRISKIQERYIIKGDSILEGDIVNFTGLTIEYSEITRDKLNKSFYGKELRKGKDLVSLDLILGILDKEGYENGMYDLGKLKELELYAELYEKTGDEKYKGRLITSMYQIKVNSKSYLQYQDALDKINEIEGLRGMRPQIKAGRDAVEEIYQGYMSPKVKVSDFWQIPPGVPIQSIVYGNIKYYVTLERSGMSQEYFIDKVYDFDGRLISNDAEVRRAYSRFIKYDVSDYINPYLSNPVVRYYETEPYKGLPAVVPFDRQNGWYVNIKQTTSALGNIRSYDDSGRINSFWLCNIGENRIEDFSEGREEDDICQQINLNTGQSFNQFPGLTESQAATKVDRAIRAVERASRSYKPGVKSVGIGGSVFEVGSPAATFYGTECQDVMSPKDCNLMFNVCDPVICPSSRCDFGGAYPVRDVIQSGIIGSVALCLPNAKEGIAVPVCLTGVKAGIDGFSSVMKSYRDCLEQNLKTGETVGVCDQIHSIYVCEFLWRQAIPLSRVAVPKMLSLFTGQNVRGGGEYLGIQSAFDNLEKSMNFFTQNYAINSYNAFKARSQEEIGSAVCKNFISMSYPRGQGFLDVLTEADSPPQFNGNFEVIPFTTATNPPIDHYKVYFHIFAGNDRGAFYQVYLRGGGGSYYFDTFSGRNVASGYIPIGGYESRTVDFTAPSGYRELCIRVNDIEECGFKEVSTNFARNYIKDQFVQRQINNTNIRSEKECVSGSADAYSLLNLNVQEGVGNILDPAIYNRGLIRICSTDNPGRGSDPFYPGGNQRWVEVGNCGDASKCWLDTQSVDRTLEFEVNVDESLDDLTRRTIERFEEMEGYLNPEDFDKNVTSIKNETELNKRLEMIKNIFDKIYRNNQRAYLIYLRGEIYDKISRGFFFEHFIRRDIPIEREEGAENREVLERPKTINDVIESPDFVSPIYEYRDGRIGTNLCFKFFDGKWHWGSVCEEIGERRGGYLGPIPAVEFDWKEVSKVADYEMNRRNYELVLSLGVENREYSYFAGMDTFLRTLKSERGNLFSNPIFIARDIGEVNNEGVYQLYDDAIGENIKFKFEGGKWFWGFPDSVTEDRAWVNSSILQHPILVRYNLKPNEKLILSHLRNHQTELEGAIILLGGNAVISPLGETIIGESPPITPRPDVPEIERREDIVIPGGLEVCPAIVPSQEILKINDVRQRVLKAAEELNGRIVPGEANAHCFEAVEHVYQVAGVLYTGCRYSEEYGKKVNVDGEIVTLGVDRNNRGQIIHVVYENREGICEYNRRDLEITEREKLALIKPGDLIDYVYSPTFGHSVVFIRWENPNEMKNAIVFDWNGRSIAEGDRAPSGEICEEEDLRFSSDNKCKVYRYTVVNLRDDSHKVYKTGSPFLG